MSSKPYRIAKTQGNNSFIDTYVWLHYRSIIQTTKGIVLVQQSIESGTMFPPGYATTFGKPCVGVVTKCDLGSKEQIENAKKYLKLAGAKEIFVTSSYTGEGFDAFLKYMEEMDSHA